MRIGIVVDSCCDLPKEFIEENRIVVMPITLRIGELLIEDRRDPQETQAFYTKHLDQKSEDFAESIPFSVQQIEKLFLEKLVLDYDYVFCLTITSGRSAIYDHAMQASRTILTKYRDVRRAAGVPERFGLAVLSSRNMFAGQGVQAAEAVRLRDGRGRGHLRRVAHKGDGVCVKIRLERVCQQIHPVFLAATAVDIRVPILRGGTQINSGHVQNLPSFPVYA